MEKCSWCGALIIGKPVNPGQAGYVEFDEQGETKVICEVGFCSGGCAWRWGIESHRLLGITGKAARRHLIGEHGLAVGVPAGHQSQECLEFFAREAKMIMRVVSPGEASIIGA